MITLLTFSFSSLFYWKNTVYNTWHTKRVLRDYVIGEASSQQEAIKFWGSKNYLWNFFVCRGWFQLANTWNTVHAEMTERGNYYTTREKQPKTYRQKKAYMKSGPKRQISQPNQKT